MRAIARTVFTLLAAVALCAGTAVAYHQVVTVPAKKSAAKTAKAKKKNRCTVSQSSRRTPLIRANGKFPGQFATSRVVTLRAKTRKGRCGVFVGLRGVADSRAGRSVQRALAPYLWMRVQLQGQRYSKRKCARKRGKRCVRYRSCPRATKPSRRTARRGPLAYCARVTYRQGPLLRLASTKRSRVAVLRRGVPAKARVLVGLDTSAPGTVAGASTRFDIVWYSRPL